jgi:transcriptional regulator with XRE-family HTH domain
MEIDSNLKARHFIATMPDVCRELRKMVGLTLVQLSNIVGMSFISLHSYETGKRVPKASTAGKYLGYLLTEASLAGINIDDVKLRVLARRPLRYSKLAPSPVTPQDTPPMPEQHDGDGPQAHLIAARAYTGEGT